MAVRSNYSAHSFIGTIVQLGIAFCVFLLIWLGVLDFSAWQQVTDLHQTQAPLMLLVDHPHFSRYLIAMPGLIVDQYYGETAFSLYISLFMLASMYIMYTLLKSQHISVIFVACFAIFVAHLFMNGRGAISWLGWMILLRIISGNAKENSIIKILTIFFALLCCSVSSGTFTVAFAAIILFLLKEGLFERKFSSILTVAAIGFLYTGLAYEGFERNISYYSLGSGNVFINMLEHGLGKIVSNNPFITTMALSILTIMLTFIIFAVDQKIKFWEVVVILVPMAGGIFGYTTLTLVMPALILVILSRIGSQRKTQSNRQYPKAQSPRHREGWQF